MTDLNVTLYVDTLTPFLPAVLVDNYVSSRLQNYFGGKYTIKITEY